MGDSSFAGAASWDSLPVHAGHFRELSRVPMIMTAAHYVDYPMRQPYPLLFLKEMLEATSREEVVILLQYFWNGARPEAIHKALAEEAFLKARYPRAQFWHLGQTAEHHRMLAAAGFQCEFINQNAWTSEYLFNIQPRIQKIYDAVYNGRLASYKRHPLAARVKSLAVITGRGLDPSQSWYPAVAREALPQAVWLNAPWSAGSNDLPIPLIARHLNQARVGLCLSAEEGAMYASVEYLLCGLPVVTTHNKGGRDELFDPAYVVWVDDTPEAVAEGVRELIARRLDPEEVRRRTLERMQPHRDRMGQLLRRWIPEDGKFARLWQAINRNWSLLRPVLQCWNPSGERYLRAVDSFR